MAQGIYRGWWALSALSITETVSYGILYYAFTVFVAPMAQEFGASAAAVAGAYSLGLVVSGLVAGWVGRIVDAHGARAVMTIGSVAAGALLFAWSLVDGLLGLYLVWAALGLVLATVLYEPAFAVLAVWFDALRSRALTILTFVAGLASVIFLPLSGALTEAFGWREALRILAVVQWGVTVPLHLFVLRRHPRDVGQEVDGGARPRTGGTPPRASVAPAAAYAGRAFALLTASFTLSTMAIFALGVHLVPLLVARGMSGVEAAAIGGAIGVAAMPGRLVFTPLGAIVSRHLVAAAIFGASALGLLALAGLPGGFGVWAFVVLYGAGFGAITPARAALVAETFGSAHYGAISGRMTVIGTPFRALAPVALGAALDAGVAPAWIAVALASATFAAATLVAAARPGSARRTAGGGTEV